MNKKYLKQLKKIKKLLLPLIKINIFTVVVFLMIGGLTVYFFMSREISIKLQRSQQLFYLDQEIISAHEHVAVRAITCYTNLQNCDQNDLNKYLHQATIDINNFEIKKKEVIQKYPYLLSTSDQKIWGVK